MERKLYKPKQFNLSGLKGISDQTLEMHIKLYEGYVKNVNLLNEELAGLSEKKQFGPQFAEIKRRLGF